jgi:hypothetical protein
MVILTVAGALGLAGCASGGESSAEPAAPATEGGEAQAGLEHIHGLGVDPGDGTLFVATHNGLYSAEEGERRVEPVGEVGQDIMGFSVVAADRFIGSGHPAPTQGPAAASRPHRIAGRRTQLGQRLAPGRGGLPRPALLRSSGVRLRRHAGPAHGVEQRRTGLAAAHATRRDVRPGDRPG